MVLIWALISILRLTTMSTEILDKYDSPDRSTEGGSDSKILSLPSDPNVREHNKPYIALKVGEYPRIPNKPEWCHCFLRFSSKVSTGYAECYIRHVYQIAQKHFGRDRVHFWHELATREVSNAPRPYYTWGEVHAADDRLKELYGKDTSTS